MSRSYPQCIILISCAYYDNVCRFICQWLHIYELVNLYFWRFHLEIALVICLNTWSLVNFSVVIRYLPREVDPLVYNMSMEDPGDINYNQVGGLGEQVRELREVIELPLINPELFQVSDNIHWQGVWSECHRQNAGIGNATDLFVCGLGEDFFYLGWFQAMAFCHWSFVPRFRCDLETKCQRQNTEYELVNTMSYWTP